MPIVATMKNGAMLCEAARTDENEIIDVVCTSMERLPENEKIARADIEKMVKYLFGETKPQLIFKAVFDKKIQGVIGYEIDKDKTCEIHFLSTREKCQGYGTALEEFMCNYVKGIDLDGEGSKVDEIMIKTRSSSHAFFEKHDYVEIDSIGQSVKSLNL